MEGIARPIGRAAAIWLACVVAPAATAQEWGMFSRLAGKTLLTGGTEKAHQSCQVKVEREPVFDCRLVVGKSVFPMTYTFHANGTVDILSNGQLSRQAVEYSENGIMWGDANVTNFWWLEADGGLSMVMRSPSGLAPSRPIYTPGRWVVADPADLKGSLKRATDAFVAFHQATDAEALFRRLSLDRSTLLGAPVVPGGPTVAGVPQAPIVAATAVPSVSPARSTGPRIALVIGNARYGAAFGDLANPVRDATLVAESLRRAGFAVEVMADADQRSMKAAIARLGQRLRSAGRAATGLFYYAGHGLQTGGANYLIPVGTAIASEADVDLDAVPADAVLSQMEQAGVGTSIVILDACRNVPVLRRDRAAARGLARMDAPNGSFVAYSTAPGQTAGDGDGINSPFATALAREMARPGQPIETTFRNVRAAVFDATAGRQTPWDSSSLFRSFYFTGE